MKSMMRTSILVSRRSLGCMIAGGSSVALFAPAYSAESGAASQRGTAQDLSEIQQLLYRYARAVDDRDTKAMQECFAPGGLFTPEQLAQGIDLHRKFEYTVHNVLNFLYTIQGDTAVGMQYSLVTYVMNSAGKLTKFDTHARYEDDRLTKRDGRWLFIKRKWTPIFSTDEVPVLKGLPPGFFDGPK